MEPIDYIDWDEGREDAPPPASINECGCNQCLDEAMAKVAKETVNAHVHSTFAQTLNSWASIGNGLYVRTASKRRKR